MSDAGRDEPGKIDNRFRLAAASDLPDLRDRIYSPTLAPLAPVRETDPRVFHPETGEGLPVGLRVAVRDQGRTPTCTGQALAALIDILRTQQAGDDPVPPASARMLYRMARQYDSSPHPSGGLMSLRAVIKTFYHYGCCADGRLQPSGAVLDEVPEDAGIWSFYDETEDDDDDTAFRFDVGRAKAAQSLPLGAYYRLAPRLNDYHAAINEVGAVIVSASIHDGWAKKPVAAVIEDRKEKGEIDYRIGRSLGVHAFVIVGYNRKGFLILNSWGPDWGCYRNWPGIALWRYNDWADSIQDGWVVRLGVSTPGAFQFSVGEQGINFRDMPIQASAQRENILGSTPLHEILGHFSHLDDGVHVRRGAYATFRESVDETIRHLHGTPLPRPAVERVRGGEQEPPADVLEAATALPDPPEDFWYRGVLLWIGGSLEGLKDAVTLAVNRKEQIKGRRLYPYSILWCSDFVEETTAVLARMFDDVKGRIGDTGDYLDRAIEASCRGVGRAFWRDIATGAARATRRDQDGTHILDSFLSLRHMGVHLVVEGAGAIFLDGYLRYLTGHPQRKALLDNILTVDFVTPAIRIDQVMRHAHWSGFLKGDRFRVESGTGQSRLPDDHPLRLWVPSAKDEDRLVVDVYGKSILHLIANGFEDRMPRTTLSDEEHFDFSMLSREQRRRGLVGPPLLGMAEKSSGIETARRSHAMRDVARNIKVLEIPTPKTTRNRLSHQELVQNPAFFELILNRITEGRSDAS